MAEKQSDKQVVFMVGESHGAHHGDRRELDKAQAADLVARGLARYPASK